MILNRGYSTCNCYVYIIGLFFKMPDKELVSPQDVWNYLILQFPFSEDSGRVMCGGEEDEEYTVFLPERVAGSEGV